MQNDAEGNCGVPPENLSQSTVENKQDLKSCTLSLEFEFNPGQISGKKMKDVGSEGEKINHEATA